jgi:hypothetical protein
VLPARATALYESASKTVLCLDCGDGRGVGDSAVRGLAGRSARREYEKRSDAREARIRANHPKIGGLLLAVSEEPQHIRAWDTGARGEERLGQRLDQLDGVARVLHDRRIPGSRANIDHIAVSSSGVYVIDAKKYTGAPTRRTTGGLFSPTVEHLFVGSRERTKLVDGMEWQVQQVELALGSIETTVRVRGMLCFVDADWPLIGGSFRIRETDVLWPKKAAQLIGAAGSLTNAEVDRIHTNLARIFPAA